MAIAAINAFINSPETARALASLYEQTVRRIVKELVAGVSKAGAFRAEQMLARVRVLLKELDPRAASRVRAWIRTQIPKAFVIGDQEATKELQAALGNAPAAVAGELPAVNGAFTLVNQQAMRGVMAAMELTLTKAHADMEQLLGTVIRRTQTSLEHAAAINRSVVEGFIRGSAPQQIADDIASALLGKALPADVRDRLKATGFDASMFKSFEAVARGKIIRVGKRNFSVRSYADLVAHTRLGEASKVATVTRLKQNGINHVQVIRHEQEHLDVCTAFMTKVFYIGEGADPLGFPPLRSTPNGGPPFHPYCECRLKSYVVPLKSGLQIEKDRGTADLLPANFFGTTSAQVTELVQNMSPDELRRIGLPAAAIAQAKKEAS